MSASAPAKGGLQHSMGLPQLFSIAFASMIGVAWITLLGVWLERAGPIGSLIGFAGGLVVILLIILAYAEVSALYPVAGAEVAYAQIAFGGGGAFITACMLWIVYASVICFEVISTGWIAGVVFPAVKGQVLYSVLGVDVWSGELLIGSVTLAVLTWVNVVGAKAAGEAQLVLMVLKIAVSALFIGAGLMAAQPQNLQPAIVFTAGDWPWAGVFSIFSMSLLFYGGFNYLPQALEERDAKVSARQVCWAMIFAAVAAFIFYALVILSASMVLPREALMKVDLPTAAAFEAALGSVLLRNLVLLAGFLGVVTAMNGTLFAASRILLLLSDLKLAPAWLGKVSHAKGTPVCALLVTALIAGAGAMFGKGAIGVLVGGAGAAIPLAWAMVCVTALKLRITKPNLHRPLKVAFGPLIFILGLLGALFSLSVVLVESFGQGAAAAPQLWAIIICFGVCLALWFGGGLRRAEISEDERLHIITGRASLNEGAKPAESAPGPGGLTQNNEMHHEK